MDLELEDYYGKGVRGVYKERLGWGKREAEELGLPVITARGCVGG